MQRKSQKILAFKTIQVLRQILRSTAIIIVSSILVRYRMLWPLFLLQA